MSDQTEHYDFIVIGSGPAGQKAAVQAAKAGRSTLLVERAKSVGGACVHHGTIPSKTLRETAHYFSGLQERAEGAIDMALTADVQVASLMTRVRNVVTAHEAFLTDQLDRNDIVRMHGRASFKSPTEIEVRTVRGEHKLFTADIIVIATGSSPRHPANVPIDHEHILDSDSILSMNYLPTTLTVLGGGVIASEYATIFACLGVEVTIVDKAPRPLMFLDEEMSDRLLIRFEGSLGCEYLGGQEIEEIHWDGISQVETTLASGQKIHSEKMLCALGRVANLDSLNLEAAGLQPTDRGVLEVDEMCRTKVQHIYAVGDVIGPPALASTAMEQGRRAARHALGMSIEDETQSIPVGIYTIPEISTVGLSEQEATDQYGGAICGVAQFSELARAQIACSTDGYLKLVSDKRGEKVLGAQIYGEGATELIHVAQLAILTDCCVDMFVDNIFNFPTLAEAYRVAAFKIVRQRQAASASATPASV